MRLRDYAFNLCRIVGMGLFFVKIEIVPVEFHSSLHTLQVWIYHCSSAPYYVLDGIIFPQVFFEKEETSPRPLHQSMHAAILLKINVKYVLSTNL